MPTVSIRLAQLIAHTLRTGGLDPIGALRGVGLSPADLADDEARIPLTSEVTLWQAASSLTGDEHFGLRAALTYRSGQFGVVDYACRSAPTLRGALERVIRYNRLLHDLAEFRLEEHGAQARVLHLWHAAPSELCREAETYTVAAGFIAARAWTGAPLPLHAVHFRHAAPTDIEPLVQLFGTRNVEFGAPHGMIAFDRALLERPLVAAEPGLCAVLDRHVDALLAQLPRAEDFSGRVRELLASSLRDGTPSAKSLAESLHMSVRTLNRRLASEETSVGAELEAVRRGLALRYLEDPQVSIAETAFLLGYSEARAFHRAFKAWTGQTPGAWRASRETSGA